MLKPGPSGAETDDRAALQDLLDERARAVLEGDRRAFLETVSAGSSGFVEAQERLFEGLRSLPLDSYELVVDWDAAGDLARRSDRRAHPDATKVMIPLVQERLSLSGVDGRPAIESIFFTFVRSDGRWSIADDSALDEAGLFSARNLWNDGPVTVEEQGTFLLIGHPCSGAGSDPHDCARLGETFLDVAERALDNVEEGLPEVPLPARVAILAPGTESELGRMLQATYELDDFLAFATSSVDASRGMEFTGHRIALNWSRLSDASDSYLETILTHELVHIATRPRAGPFTPFFLDEGIAEVVARRDEAGSLRALEDAIENGAFDRRLPEDHEFRTGGPTSVFLSYKESQAAIGFLIERWGREAFVDLYEELGERRVRAGTTTYHLDRALRSTIGIGLERFERAWADSIA